MKKPIAAKTAVLFCLALSLTRYGQTQDITGYWQATELVGKGVYRELLHVWKTKSGELAATIEYLDTGGQIVPVTSISVSQSKLTFQIVFDNSVKASYEGSLNAEGSAISGVWKQPPDDNEKPLNFSRSSAPKAASAKRPFDIDGYWTGTLKYNPIPGCDPASSEIQYSFHITNTVEGPTATFNIPDNGTLGWAATSVTREGPLVSIEMKQLAGTFQGILNKKKTALAGTWTQRDRSYPLVLMRSKNLPKPVDRPGCSIDGM